MVKVGAIAAATCALALACGKDKVEENKLHRLVTIQRGILTAEVAVANCQLKDGNSGLWLGCVMGELAQQGPGAPDHHGPGDSPHLRHGLVIQPEAAMVHIIVNQRLQAGAQIGDQRHRPFFSACFHKTLEKIVFHSTAST